MIENQVREMPMKVSLYYLRPPLLKRVIAIVQDYHERAAEYEDAPDTSPNRSGAPRNGSGVSDPTGVKGDRRVEIAMELEAVERAIQAVPARFRDGVWYRVYSETPYPRDQRISAYQKWRRIFLYNVAKNLKLI